MYQRIRQRLNMASFGIGILAGGLITILLLAILLRLMGGSQLITLPTEQSGPPDLTLTLNRGLLQRLVGDSLRGVSLPLVSLRDPSVQLEPNGVIVVRLRGDTILLGAQMIVLRMRLMPAPTGVQVVTQSADVAGLGDVAGALTRRLDEQINAEIARRLTFADQFEVLSVGGTTEDVIITARMKD